MRHRANTASQTMSSPSWPDSLMSRPNSEPYTVPSAQIKVLKPFSPSTTLSMTNSTASDFLRIFISSPYPISTTATGTPTGC